MLIRFYLENFLSFKDQIEFSMIPGRGRLFPNHIARSEKSTGINILKTAAIYGPNAAGKSNLLKAIDFARNLIVSGTKPNENINIKRFRLNVKCEKKPSKFQFEFKHNEKYYSYGFILDSSRIHEEWLYSINKHRENLLFKRITEKDGITKVEFAKKIVSEPKNKQFLLFVGQGTRPNQLFLTESIDRNVKEFILPYEWFDNVLKVIFPNSKYFGIEFFFSKMQEFKKELLLLVRFFDQSISDIECKTYKLEEDLPNIPQEIKDKLRIGLSKRNAIASLTSPREEKYLVYLESNEVMKALQLTTKHQIAGSKKTAIFEMHEESDGTQRMFDFFPFLFSSIFKESVFLIDEIDRSLHPLLVKKFLEIFLKLSEKINSQLIFTTHDSIFLNLKLLRKDEIWFIQKNINGESELYSLEEYKPRYDKDIKNGYLWGRFGAIPTFKNINEITLNKNNI